MGRNMKQTIISGQESIRQLGRILEDIGSHRFLLVCDNSYSYLSIKDEIESVNIQYIRFSDFTSNPLYEDVCKGVTLFNTKSCDAIVAIGGGSTIDVAKCIKLYSKMDVSINYLKQDCFDSKVPLIAIPTTAGTGSESTRYAVIYYEGEKQSVMHESIMPNYAILDPRVLKTLPIYQKKCTMLDALCQGIESWWSVNSTDESKGYSRQAISLIIANWEGFIEKSTDNAAEQIMLAANYAGRAINITQTTAVHAMSYKLTSMYHLPHGHAVAICLPHVWRYMNAHLDKCIDPRGQKYLAGVFEDISIQMGCINVQKAVELIEQLIAKLEIQNPKEQNSDKIDILVTSVNSVRLKNNPVKLDEDALRILYSHIVAK